MKKAFKWLMKFLRLDFTAQAEKEVMADAARDGETAEANTHYGADH